MRLHFVYARLFDCNDLPYYYQRFSCSLPFFSVLNTINLVALPGIPAEGGEESHYHEFSMPWNFPTRVLLLLLALGAILMPVLLAAQEDPNEIPLGDVARNLRKKTGSPPVIDDDNLSEALREGQLHRGFGSSLRLLMAGDLNGLRVSAPDVTCNLSFSSNVRTLLSSQYSEMTLPADELARLEGHASIAGDILTVSVHNATDWHVSEISVALTVLTKTELADAAGKEPGANLQPGTEAESAADQVGKKPDSTVIYRMRAVGVPWSATNFSARLNIELAPGEEWHWAIVQARGYPPESYRRSVTSQPAEETNAGQDTTIVDDFPKTPQVTPVSNSDRGAQRLLPASSPQ